MICPGCNKHIVSGNDEDSAFCIECGKQYCVFCINQAQMCPDCWKKPKQEIIEALRDFLRGQKGICGYGRYDIDPELVGCPRAQSDMTPCAARDGTAAMTDDGRCIGCGEKVGDLFKNLVKVISNLQRDLAQ